MLPPFKSDTILRERYRLTNIVGQGGMGSVYRAEDLRLPGRYCAIKEVQIDPKASQEMRDQAREQFFQEASILARLDHPNLPKVSDFFSDEGRDFLVMDFVPGDDLKQVLDSAIEKEELLDADAVLGWAEELLSALTYLHNYDPPILHRDIKPANIKLTPDNRIKLVDFGLVKLLAEDDSRTVTVVQGRGTALFTPLEQYGTDSGHTDVRSDIYSLGATLYNLLTGRAPQSAKERFLNPSAMRPPRVLNPTVTRQASDAVMWAMQMHPKDRPESIDVLQEALLGDGDVVVPDQNQLNTDVVEALWANRVTAMVAAFLFVIALLLTIL